MDNIFGKYQFAPITWCRFVLPKKFSKCVICFKSLFTECNCFLCLQCNNVYHKTCIEKWYDQNNNLVCPMCRQGDKFHYFGNKFK